METKPLRYSLLITQNTISLACLKCKCLCFRFLRGHRQLQENDLLECRVKGNVWCIGGFSGLRLG